VSNLDRTPAWTATGGTTEVAPTPVHQVFAGREVLLGESTKVRRLLPNLGRRLVGAWCFVDHYGPDDIAAGTGMQVPPHPHIGLQTVSWLLTGQVHHRDSLGSDQVIEPGQLGLMTAGAAIAHAEQSPVPHPALLHGVQLWVALPDESRHMAPAWAYHDEVPVLQESDARITVILGELGQAVSPGRTHSPLVGADVELRRGADTLLPLEPEFEHAVLVMSGAAEVDGLALAPGAMLYLGTARRSLRVRSDFPARLMLLGGAPFEERIVMWWNFVARTGDEIADARGEWMSGKTFDDVPGFGGYRLPSPNLPPGQLRPGGAVRER
jgi:redox-sensitive bicupin YhaK (pirin superfamily)